MKRATKISLIRGCFYALNKDDLKRFGDAVANAFAGSIIVYDVLPNREGDFRLSVRVYLKEVITND